MNLEKELHDHFESDKTNFKKFDLQLAAQGKTLKHIAREMHRKPTAEEIEKSEKDFDDRIELAMKKALLGTSKTSYQVLLVVAGIVGALLIIFGGFTKVLTLLGFTRN